MPSTEHTTQRLYVLAEEHAERRAVAARSLAAWGALTAALVVVATMRPVPPLLTAVCGGACMAAAIRLLAVCVVGRERIRAAQVDE